MNLIRIAILLSLCSIQLVYGVIKKDCITYAKDFHPLRELKVTRKSISVVNIEWSGLSIEYCIDKSITEGQINFIFESSGIPLTIIESQNTHIVYKHDNNIDIYDFVFDPVKNITFYTGIKCGSICLRSKVEVVELVDGLRKIYSNNYPVTTRPTIRPSRTTTRRTTSVTTRPTTTTTTADNPLAVCRESYGLRRVTVTEVNCTHSLVKWDGADGVSYCNEYYSISNDKVLTTLEGSGLMVFLIYGSNVHLVQTRTNSLIVHQQHEHVTIYTKIDCDGFCIETKPAIISLKNNTQIFDVSTFERQTPSTTHIPNTFTTIPSTTATQPGLFTIIRNITNHCNHLDNILNLTVRRIDNGKVSIRWSGPQILDYCGTSHVDFKGSSIYLNDGSGLLVYVIDGGTMYVVRLSTNSFILSPTVSNIRVFTKIRCNSACLDTNHQIINLNNIA